MEMDLPASPSLCLVSLSLCVSHCLSNVETFALCSSAGWLTPGFGEGAPHAFCRSELAFMGAPPPPKEVGDLHLFIQRPWGSPRRDGNQPAAEQGTQISRIQSHSSSRPLPQDFSSQASGNSVLLPVVRGAGWFLCRRSASTKMVQSGVSSAVIFQESRMG